jgi:DNA-binding ferritin-like protein (Dps family)
MIVARQIKAHPGLRQAGRAWYKTARKSLIARGYVPSAVAPCVFTKDAPCGGYMCVGVFVDDIVGLNVTNDRNALQELADSLKDDFEIKVTKLEKFLGAQYDVGEDGVRMHLTQYITGMLERFEMGTCKAVKNPELTREDIALPPDETELPQRAIKRYQEKVGALMFAQTCCRLDLAHAVGMLARKMGAPRACDDAAATQVFRFLQGTTQELGILFRFASDASHPGLVAFCDSDWAGGPEGRRSTGGFVVLYNMAPVTWSSQLQAVVATSSCEAEYIAASETAREVSYLRELLLAMMNPQAGPTVIYGDNQGALQLIENPTAHKRTKHIEVKFHYVRVAQERFVIKMVKVHTDLNPADIMTKATGTGTFCRHVDLLMSRPAAEPTAAVTATPAAVIAAKLVAAPAGARRQILRRKHV